MKVLASFFLLLFCPFDMEAYLITPMPIARPSSRLGSTASRLCATTSDGLDERIRRPGTTTNTSGSTISNKKKKKKLPLATSVAAFVTLFWATSARAAKAVSSLAAAPATSALVPPATSSIALSWLHQHLFAASSLLLLFNTFGAAIFKLLSAFSWQQSAAWYMAQLAAYPVLTKSITAAAIGYTGDLGAQWIEHRLISQQRQIRHHHHHTKSASHAAATCTKWKIDVRRGLSIVLDGLLISGPLLHVGYELFERILPIAAGGSSGSLAAAVHVVADSLFLDSIFVATTFLVTGLVEGYSFRRQLIPQFRKDYIPTVKAGLATSFLLMPIEFACFRFLPVTLRVLAVNLIDIVWDAVISFMAHRSRKSPSVAIAASAAMDVSEGEETSIHTEPQQQSQPVLVGTM